MKKYLVLLSIAALFIGCGGGGGEKTIQTTEPLVSDTNSEVSGNYSSPLEYINYLRAKVNMVSLNEVEELKKAALNHANYLYINNESGHYEDPQKAGFTGEWPADRVLYTGFLTKYVTENVSAGQKNYILSVDGLFSAIYHRFGFLKDNIDSIGIGIKNTKYVYDMGNMNVNELCSYDTYSSGPYYVGLCKDEDLKIEVDDFNKAVNDIRMQNPEITIWPYNNEKDVLPVFYEESPDPLPDYSVSGYPVSIQFNSYFYPKKVTLKWFKLYAADGSEISDVRLLDKDSDPNHELDDKKYALFPLKRLEWDSQYSVSVGYSYDGYDYTATWSFKTRKLPYDYFRIDTKNATLYIKNDKKYAYYFVPKDGNDLIRGFNYSYPSGDEVESGFIDANTVWIKVSGSSGDEIVFNFDNGNKLTLIIE